MLGFKKVLEERYGIQSSEEDKKTNTATAPAQYTVTDDEINSLPFGFRKSMLQSIVGQQPQPVTEETPATTSPASVTTNAATEGSMNAFREAERKLGQESAIFKMPTNKESIAPEVTKNVSADTKPETTVDFGSYGGRASGAPQLGEPGYVPSDDPSMQIAMQYVTGLYGGEATKAIGTLAKNIVSPALSKVVEPIKQAGTKVTQPVIQTAEKLSKMTPEAVKSVGKKGLGIGAAATGYETVKGATDPEYADRRQTFPSQFGASLRGGVGDTISMFGSAADWKDMPEVGEKLKETGAKISEGYESKQVPFSWKSVFDPDWYANNLARSIPMTASLIPIMFAAYKGGKKAASLRGFGKYGQVIIASLAGSTASRPIESMLEAAGGYEEAKAMGKSESEADAIAQRIYDENLKLAGLDSAQLALSFMPTPVKTAGKLGKTAMTAGKFAVVGGTESAEEGYQGAIQARATGQDDRSILRQILNPTPELQEAMAIGGIFGLGMGGTGVVTNMMQDIKTDTIANLPNEIMPQVEQKVVDHINEGMTPAEALDVTLDEIAEVPEVQQIIQQATQEQAAIAIDKLGQNRTDLPETVYDKNTGEQLNVVVQTSPEFLVVENSDGQRRIINLEDVSLEPISNQTSKIEPERTERIPQEETVKGEEIGTSEGEIEGREPVDIQEYADNVIKTGEVKSVTLIGSTVTQGKGNDVDILYELEGVELPEDSAEAAAEVEAFIENMQTPIDLDLYDTFIKVGDRYFHLQGGAGREIVENTEYAKDQAGKLSKVLAQRETKKAEESQAIRTVYHPTTKEPLEVISDTDPSMLTVRNSNGSVFKIGKGAVLNELPKGESITPETTSKQPWQMTLDEFSGLWDRFTAWGVDELETISDQEKSLFNSWYDEGMQNVNKKINIKDVLPTIEAIFANKTKGKPGAFEHYFYVKQALAEGKSVPPEVLAEYPDLIKQDVSKAPDETAANTADIQAGDTVYGTDGEQLTVVNAGNKNTLRVKDADGKSKVIKRSEITLEKPAETEPAGINVPVEPEETAEAIPEVIPATDTAPSITETDDIRIVDGEVYYKDKNATTAGHGKAWFTNRKSIFGGERKQIKLPDRLNDSTNTPDISGESAPKGEESKYAVGTQFLNMQEEPEIVIGKYKDGRYLVKNASLYNPNSPDFYNPVFASIVSEEELDRLASRQEEVQQQIIKRKDRETKELETEKAKADELSIGNFYSDKLPMQREKAKNTLNKFVRVTTKEGANRTVRAKQHIAEMVEEGRVFKEEQTVANKQEVLDAQKELDRIKTNGWESVVPKAKLRELESVIASPKTRIEYRAYGVYGDENLFTKINKTEYEYAQWLKGQKQPTEEAKPEQVVEPVGETAPASSGEATPDSINVGDTVYGKQSGTAMEVLSVDNEAGSLRVKSSTGNIVPIKIDKVSREKPVKGQGKVAEAKTEKKPDLTKQISSLREQAQRMQKTINEKKNPAIGNQNPTARRANIAARMYEEAERMEGIQKTLLAVADAIESGTAPDILHNIKTKSNIETLRGVLNAAHSRRARSEKLPYEKNRVLSEEDIKYAKIEGYVHPDHLKSLLTDTKGKPGTKEAATTVQKIVNAEGRFYSETSLKAIETLLGKIPDSNSSKKYIKDSIMDYKRILNMGITTDEQLQEMLKAYMELGTGRPKEKTAEQKIKEMERELIGTKIPGYFPTPKPVIDEMIENADIQAGMKVLEPSAGKGSIADAIKEAEPEAIIEVAEINSTLQSILKEKGYNIVGDDFLELKGAYDRIVMNPPFEKGQDIDHVRHAYELLKPGGKLVSIMSEGPFFRRDKKAADFGDWLIENGGTSEKLPDKSFTGKDSDRQTGVATRLVVIDKAEEVKKSVNFKLDIAGADTDSPEFKAWFGDSKVTDESGKPLVVYHGTDSTFDEFSPSYDGRFGGGIYFTDNPQSASEYATEPRTKSKFNFNEPAPQVIPVYLKMLNPWNVNELGDPRYSKKYEGLGGKYLWEEMKADSYDGIIYDARDTFGTYREYIVFSSKQVKSVNNQGTWDPVNPDIRFKSDSVNAIAKDLNLTPAPEAMEQEIFQAANTLSQIFTGNDIVTFKGKGIQGMADGDTIYLNQDAKDPVLYVAKHEIVHTLETTDPVAYKRLMNLVRRYFTGDPEMLKHYQKQKYTKEEAWGEFTSDVISEVMEQPGFWKMVREKAPKVIKAVVDVIDQIISKFKKAVAKEDSMLKYIDDIVAFKAEVAGVVAESLSKPKRKGIFDLRTESEIAAKNKKGSIKNTESDKISPTGKTNRLGEKMTDTAEFKKWFGDSKVVDENGEPLVVYHGSPQEFEEFDIEETSGMIWLTNNKLYAKDFTKNKGKVKELYASIKNPVNASGYEQEMLLSDWQEVLEELGANVDDIDWDIINFAPDYGLYYWYDLFPHAGNNYDDGGTLKALKEAGYDGMITPKESINGIESDKTFVAFSPTQIKSIYNQGSFDSKNPDIRYKREGNKTTNLFKGIGTQVSKAKKGKAEEKKFTLPEKYSEVGERIEGSRGVPQDTVRANIAELWDEIKRKGHREFEHLPRTGEFSELRNALLNLRKQKGISTDKTLRLLDDVTKPLNEYEYDVFSHKVIFDDLAHEFEEGNLLPFGLTEENFEDINNYINEEAAKLPKVQEAVNKRKQAWQEIKNRYTKAMREVGFNVEDRLRKEDYYHHQVLEYANAKGVMGAGKKLRIATGRGFLKQRGGSSYDINSDYLQAEFEVMAQMLLDAAAAKTVKVVKQNHDIVNELKKEAIRLNDEAMLEEFRKLLEIAKDTETTPEQLYRRLLNKKQAIAFGDLYKLAAKGELPAGPNGKYEKLIDEMAQAYDVNKKEPELPENIRKELWQYLNYLAGNEHDNETAKIVARTIFKGRAEKIKKIKNALGSKYLTWEDLIPEGYTLWQPREGHMFFMATTIPQGMAEQLFYGIMDEMNLNADMLKKEMVVGQKYPEMVVKEEVALTLEELYSNLNKQSPIAKYLYFTPYRAWKQWQLISPRRYFRYNARNMTGDIDAVIAGNPSALRPANIKKAWQDLWNAFFTKEQVFSKELYDWFERGGFETLMQAQEINDINRNRQFKHLMEKRMQQVLDERHVAEKSWDLVKAGWYKYWDFARTTTDFREAFLRYACYLDYLSQIEGNNGKPKNWGASNRDEIMALADNKNKAAKMANELLGAYDEVSVIGVWLAEHMMPFWRWNEVNFVRYGKLLRNAAQDGKLMATLAGKTTGLLIRSPYIAWKVGKFVLMASALSMMINLWNWMFFRDEDKELPEDVRSRLHIVFGRDKDGNILYFSRLGALQDFLDWFGLDTPIKHIQDYLSGRKGIAEVAIDIAKNDPNKLVNAVTPFIKTPVELLTGKKMYPDVFEMMPVRDRWQYLAESFGLGSEYKALTGKPTRGYASSIPSMFIYVSDPYETAYYANKENLVRYRKKIGTYTEGYSENQRSEALYNVKLAMRYGDRKAFEKYMLEYAALGGTEKGLKQSFKSMHPLYGLNQDKWQDYVDSLDGVEKENLIKALDYYERVISGSMFVEEESES